MKIFFKYLEYFFTNLFHASNTHVPNFVLSLCFLCHYGKAYIHKTFTFANLCAALQFSKPDFVLRNVTKFKDFSPPPFFKSTQRHLRMTHANSIVFAKNQNHVDAQSSMSIEPKLFLSTFFNLFFLFLNGKFRHKVFNKIKVI